MIQNTDAQGNQIVGIKFVQAEVADANLMPTGEPAMMMLLVIRTIHGNFYKQPLMEVGWGG